jgi:hypothetical protein
MQQLRNGETYDFELAPAMPGDLRFTVTSAAGALPASVPVRVRCPVIPHERSECRDPSYAQQIPTLAR